jgi:cold shock CspA family protein
MMGELYMRRLPAVDDCTVRISAAVGKGLIAPEGNADVHLNRMALKDERVRVLKTGDRTSDAPMQGGIAPRDTNVHKTSGPEPIIEEFPVVSDSAAGSFFG